MKAVLPVSSIGNPFSVRRVRPGAVPFFFPPGESLHGVLDRLETAGWWGQVVGPHGSGKSTLLAALLPALKGAGREPFLVVLHDGQRVLPAETWSALRRVGRPPVVVIDGFEQLSRWNRFRVRRWCRRHGHGLLVTAHADMGLPDVYRTQVTPATALRVFGYLLPGPARTITAADVTARLAAHAGNFREALFDLYDLYERRRGSSPRA